MDVDKFLKEQGITREQFDEFVEMNSIVPLGDEKLAWVMALGFCVLANRIGSALMMLGAKGVKDFEPSDFIPWKKRTKRKRKDKPVNPAVLTSLLKQQIAASGGA